MCRALTRRPSPRWGNDDGQPDRRAADRFAAWRRGKRPAHSSEAYVVTTLVTTELIRRIADTYGVQTAGNLLVGFKYIGGEMDHRGPKDFVFGTEESYGSWPAITFATRTPPWPRCWWPSWPRG